MKYVKNDHLIMLNASVLEANELEYKSIEKANVKSGTNCVMGFEMKEHLKVDYSTEYTDK